MFLQQNEIKVALLQEIWLKKEEHFRLNNFILVSNRRQQGYGGVGILIHEKLGYQTLDIGNFLPIEAVAIKVIREFDPITFVSVYVPPDHDLAGEIKHKMKDLFEVLETRRRDNSGRRLE